MTFTAACGRFFVSGLCRFGRLGEPEDARCRQGPGRGACCACGRRGLLSEPDEQAAAVYLAGAALVSEMGGGGISVGTELAEQAERLAALYNLPFFARLWRAFFWGEARQEEQGAGCR